MKTGKGKKSAAIILLVAAVVAVISIVTVNGCGVTSTFNPVTLTGIVITPTDSSVVSGATLTLKAEGVYSDSTKKDMTNSVTWTSSDETIAKISSGIATGVTITTNHCTITVVGPNGLGATMNLTVLNVEQAIMTIDVTAPNGSSISQYSTAQLTATGNMSNGTTMDLTSKAVWTSSAPAKVDVFSAGSTTPGLATAKTSGTAIIKASIGAKKGTLSVTVTPATALSLELQSASSAITAANINPGGTVQLAAIATFAGNKTIDVTSQATWTSSAPTVVSVNASGLASGLTGGTAVIYATLGNVSSGNVTVTVNNVSVTSIAIQPSGAGATVAKGSTLQLTATATYDNNSTGNVSGQATWTSSAPAKATVDATGKVTGVDIGSADIVAIYSGQSNTVTVTVTAPAVALQSITLSNTDNYGDWAVNMNQVISFIATGHYSDGTTKDITTQVIWSSSDTSNATIVSTTGVVTAVGGSTSGDITVTITATLGTVHADQILTIFKILGHC